MKFPDPNIKKDDDLLQRLLQVPEHKPEPGVEAHPAPHFPGAQQSPPLPPPQPEPNDFEAEIQPESPPPPPAEPPPPPRPFSDFKTEAEGIISLLDAGQVLFIPALYYRKRFDRIELAIAKQIALEREKNRQYQVPDEYADVMRRYDELQALISKIPYTPDERQMVITPLAEVLQKYNAALGPEWRLIGAIAALSFPRFLPLFVNS